jgi:hypothetical protein
MAEEHGREQRPATLWTRGKPEPDLDVANVIEARVKTGNSKPEIVWMEPRPRWDTGGPQRTPSRGLSEGSPQKEDLERGLDEARLFWKDRTLHVVADGNGSRWFECTLEAPAETGEASVPGPEWKERKVVLRSRVVHLRVPGSSGKSLKHVSIDECWDEQSLIGWLLKKAEQGGAQ